MPISGDTWLDSRDNPDYGLPKDSCVGNGTGDPFAGGKSVGRAAAQKDGSGLRIQGGPTSTSTATAYGKSGGKARAQRAKENWVPGA